MCAAAPTEPPVRPMVSRLSWGFLRTAIPVPSTRLGFLARCSKAPWGRSTRKKPNRPSSAPVGRDIRPLLPEEKVITDFKRELYGIPTNFAPASGKRCWRQAARICRRPRETSVRRADQGQRSLDFPLRGCRIDAACQERHARDQTSRKERPWTKRGLAFLRQLISDVEGAPSPASSMVNSLRSGTNTRRA